MSSNVRSNSSCVEMQQKDVMEGRKEETRQDSPATVTYRAYRRRWAITATVMLLDVCSVGMAFNLTGVAFKAADYFEVKQQSITWLSQVFLITSLLLSPINTFIYNRFDMKVGLHIGSAFICAGGVTRALATSGFIQDLWTQFCITILGQVVMAIGSTFSLTVITKLTQNWYPDEERLMATSITAFFPGLGISLAEVVAPLIVVNKHDITTLNYVYGGLAVLAQAATILCVTRSRPPTPPSPSAEQTTVRRAYLQQLKDTFTCVPYLLLLLMSATMSGVFLLLMTLSQQMLCSTGYTDVFSGMVVTLMNFMGFVGALLIAAAVNRTKALTSISKLVNAFANIGCIILLEMYLIPDQHIALVIFSILFGLLSCGVFPINLEMGVEVTFPTDETISTTPMLVLGEIVGSIMIYLADLLSRDLPPSLQQVEVCTQDITSDLQPRDYSVIITVVMAVESLTVILFILFFRSSYKRRMAEETSHHHSSSSSSSFSSSVQGL